MLQTFKLILVQFSNLPLERISFSGSTNSQILNPCRNNFSTTWQKSNLFYKKRFLNSPNPIDQRFFIILIGSFKLTTELSNALKNIAVTQTTFYNRENRETSSMSLTLLDSTCEEVMLHRSKLFSYATHSKSLSGHCNSF